MGHGQIDLDFARGQALHRLDRRNTAQSKTKNQQSSQSNSCPRGPAPSLVRPYRSMDGGL